VAVRRVGVVVVVEGGDDGGRHLARLVVRRGRRGERAGRAEGGGLQLGRVLVVVEGLLGLGVVGGGRVLRARVVEVVVVAGGLVAEVEGDVDVHAGVGWVRRAGFAHGRGTRFICGSLWAGWSLSACWCAWFLSKEESLGRLVSWASLDKLTSHSY